MAEPFSPGEGRHRSHLFGIDISLVFVVGLLLTWIHPISSASIVGRMRLNAVSQEGQEVRTLEEGKPVERELAGGQSHLYRLPLTAGQYVRLEVDQRGVEVAVRGVGPDGKVFIDFNPQINSYQPDVLSLVA